VRIEVEPADAWLRARFGQQRHARKAVAA
jgi:hypothetical protein